MHEGFKVVQMFLGIKFGPLGCAVCNTDYGKCMQVIEMSKCFPSSRLHTDLDFKTDPSLLLHIFHSRVG